MPSFLFSSGAMGAFILWVSAGGEWVYAIFWYIISYVAVNEFIPGYSRILVFWFFLIAMDGC